MRFIDNGSVGKFKQLRREVWMARSPHIRSFVHANMGIAKYENKSRYYVDAESRQLPKTNSRTT